MKLFSRLIILFATAIPLLLNGTAHALSGSDFQPGRIIDDNVFFDGNALSVQQIQSFLSAQVPTCDTNGAQVFTGYYDGRDSNGINHSPLPSPHTYIASDNIKRALLDNRYPAPYTCLKDYVENPTTHENNLSRPTFQVPGGQSAAQILYNAAQDYSVSPKVLITLIQKESIGPLTTDTWPWPTQYKTTMGYACPDTAACDSTYFGFYNQTHYASRQYRLYANNPTSYNYLPSSQNTSSSNPDGHFNILYNPNASCGTKAVVIQNQATAGLYNYTPYTPNAAALSNLYGSGDGCSAYGNRNFWRIFNDWFGAHYTFNSAVNPPDKIAFGDTVTAEIKVNNTSQETWYSDINLPPGVHPHRLMTRLYKNTIFADSSDPAWLGTQNQVRMVEQTVTPGQVATFRFNLKSPFYSIPYEELNMLIVKDGVQVYEDYGLQFRVSSVPDYAYQTTSITAPSIISPGATEGSTRLI